MVCINVITYKEIIFELGKVLFVISTVQKAITQKHG